MLQIWEILKFYGHGNIKQAELAGLLSESGYKGLYLKEIVEKAPGGGGSSFVHQSDKLRPYVPESNGGCAMACCLCVISVLGPIVCLGQSLRVFPDHQYQRHSYAACINFNTRCVPNTTKRKIKINRLTPQLGDSPANLIKSTKALVATTQGRRLDTRYPSKSRTQNLWILDPAY